MEDKEKYEAYRKAQRDGGPCPICGWQDGDGVLTCFVSPELGPVTHQNTEKGVMLSLTEEQRGLYRLREFMAYITAELREREIQRVFYERDQYALQHLKDYPGDPVYAGEHDEESFREKFRRGREGWPLADDPIYKTWAQRIWWVPIKPGTPEELRGMRKSASGVEWEAFKAYLYEPHTCGGHRIQVAPYHYGCTGCRVEIRLWEHGVDYDIG